ncbi:MAG TPA: hypothetical protein VER76_01435, partial [Pyrinomonadaceae bacterium]|nr:hypothetical protein [Pyrinomonadaceae bacterium]
FQPKLRSHYQTTQPDLYNRRASIWKQPEMRRLAPVPASRVSASRIDQSFRAAKVDTCFAPVRGEYR